MNRRPRIALNIVGPPIVAGTLFSLIGLVYEAFSAVPGDLWASLKYIPLVYYFAGILGIIPSLLHAFIMERLYDLHAPHTWRACFCSGASGLFAGVLIDGIFLVTDSISRIDAWLFLYPSFGFVVGLILGAVIKCLSTVDEAPISMRRGCE